MSHKIAVIGDLIVDHDILVRPTKIAQEAPVMVVDVLGEQFRNGGAAAVNDMVRALGTESQMPLSRSMTGIPVSMKRRLVTTAESRPSQMLMRFDSNAEFTWPEGGIGSVCRQVDEFKPDVVIISDYGKGVVCEGLIPQVRATVGSSVPILVDPYTADWSKYAGADIIVPSRSAAAHFLQDENPRGFSAVIVKLDCEGIRIYGAGSVASLPSQARAAVDPCGAGDQFIAALAVHLLKPGGAFQHAVWMANLAAGIQCERNGIVPVTSEEMRVRVAQIDEMTLAAAG